MDRDINESKLAALNYFPRKYFTKHPTVFQTIHNGLKCFKVVIDENKIEIYYIDNFNKLEYIINKRYEWEGVWTGYDPNIGSKCFSGTSILIHITEFWYLFVGDTVYDFYSPEHIDLFITPLGFSSFWYPIAFTNNYLYYLRDKKWTEREERFNFPLTPIKISNIVSHIYKKKTKALKLDIGVIIY